MTEDINQSDHEQRIRELEKRRIILNRELMDAASIKEANEIERELWALRAAIRYWRSSIKMPVADANGQSRTVS